MMRPSPRQGRSALLDGIGTEDGRIGYVALTRARDLFVLAAPETYLHPGVRTPASSSGLKARRPGGAINISDRIKSGR